MQKSLVGRVENKKFAYFWLLIGGGIGNLLLGLSFPTLWPVFIPPAILSILLAIAIANSKQRPKIWLGLDLALTVILLIFLVPVPLQPAILLPDALIIFGCFLGIMDW